MFDPANYAAILDTMTLECIVGWGQKLAVQLMQNGYLSNPLGVDLCPGTFNVYANGDHRVIGDGFDPGGVRQNGGLRALPCTANGHDGFIVRNERRGPAADRLGMEDNCTLFEIVSPTHLRNALGVTDGDRVILEYDPAEAKFFPLRSVGDST